MFNLFSLIFSYFSQRIRFFVSVFSTKTPNLSFNFHRLSEIDIVDFYILSNAVSANNFWMILSFEFVISSLGRQLGSNSDEAHF